MGIFECNLHGASHTDLDDATYATPQAEQLFSASTHLSSIVF